MNVARKRGWVAEGFAGPAVLGLAVCAYASAVALHGNGFIAAFVGGLAFGTTAGRRGEPLIPFVEETGALVSLMVWLAFGAVAVAPAVEVLNWQIVLYAVLSLTVIRMVPVAAVLIGTRLDRATIALVAWFGPRGLASVVFCLLALEELGSADCRSRRRCHHDYRGAQRRRTRCHGRSAGQLVRTAPRPSGRSRMPVPKYPAYRSAGSSAGAPAVAKPGRFTRGRGIPDAPEIARANCPGWSLTSSAPPAGPCSTPWPAAAE